MEKFGLIKRLSLSIGTGIAVCILLFIYAHNTQGFSVQEAAEQVRDAAKVYQQETGFDDASCNIGGESTSLGGLMYAIMIQEGGFKPGTVGYKTNNWGSLHSSVGLRRPAGVLCADNSCTWPKYSSIQDGLVEKAHLIASDKYRYKCSFGYKALYAYVVGPNADPNAMHITGRTNQQHITALYARMKKNAQWFDGNNTGSDGQTFNGGQSDIKGGATTQLNLPRLDTDTHTWYRVDWTKMDYIQIDSGDGEMITRIPCGESSCKIFKGSSK